MTSVPIDRAGAQLRDAGQQLATGLAWVLFAIGWVAAKTLRGIGTGVGAVLFAVGWVAGRVVWPVLMWTVAAVRLGWEEGRKPIGGRRGSA